MTFVHGPEEASFLESKPAKLRFFLGYVDEFGPGDGSNQVRGIDIYHTRVVPVVKVVRHSDWYMDIVLATFRYPLGLLGL